MQGCEKSEWTTGSSLLPSKPLAVKYGLGGVYAALHGFDMLTLFSVLWGLAVLSAEDVSFIAHIAPPPPNPYEVWVSLKKHVERLDR